MPLGLIQVGQHCLQASRQGHHFGGGSLGQPVQPVHMLVRHHHDVAAGVGKRIQDDEVVLAPIDDERLLVVARGQKLAENAAVGFVHSRDV